MFRHSPIKLQTNVLRRLLRRASNTEWGRKFGFSDLARHNDIVSAYQSRVPIHTYGDIRSQVDRMRRGEEDILCSGQVKYYAISSGTASEGKVIPLSPQTLRMGRKYAFGLSLNYLFKTGDLKPFLGKHLTLPGRVEEDQRFPGTLIGEVSGIQSLFAPYIFNKMYCAIPNSIVFTPNWDQKLQVVADLTHHQDIRLIAMAPTWAPVFFRILIQRYNEIHGTDVHTVGQIWPNLSIFISGGVALSSYQSIIEDLIALPNITFMETYGASEGMLSYQSDFDDTSMKLLLNYNIFYEFVRMEDMNKKNPQRLTIAEVETDVRYALILTTPSGLWSYSLGDVVRFTSTSPHKILVAGRTVEVMDQYGEAVFEEDARLAINQACTITNSMVREYHVSAIPPTGKITPAHEWLVEFYQAPEDCEAFLQSLDSCLCEINRHYQIRREAKAFRPPEIVAIPLGTFGEWLKASRGEIKIQTKVPRMSEGRDFSDGILNFTGDKAQRIRVEEFL
ncbi:MAG: GH3 auxin-responsive promoter family protein [Bacteroidetes bacterium]|nr:GH3 auxin-responsive promoter family protein [Bacteroidota bacterium]